MQAKDLAEDYPVVHLRDSALDAARLIGSHRRPGVVVVDDHGHPVAVLPGSQVLRFLVPSYVQADPSLAGVYDERTAQESLTRLADNRVEDLLPDRDTHTRLPVVDHDATVLGCAAAMARLHSPLLVVLEDGQMVGVATAARLLDELFG